MSTVPARSHLEPLRSPRVKVESGPDAGISTAAQRQAKRAASEASVDGSEGFARAGPEDRLSIGTAPGNDLVLHDATVSRYHLELEPRPDRILVRDLGSTNGTFLGTALVTEIAVVAGTRLRLGSTTIAIEDGGALAPDLYPADRSGPGGMIGRSAAIRGLMASIERVSRSSSSVLLLGETGSGKEVAARAIHEVSERSRGPFETVDCGTLVPTLIASELFGHEQGAFTGANQRRTGAFERACGGTLFLDEIGELPPALQIALLGALERRTIRRVGGSSQIKIDVRLICATNRDLRAEVNANRFRADLYYRIAVVMLRVPPLRERLDDLRLLVEGFLKQMGLDKPADELVPPSAWETMFSHSWPGNVRELKNFVEATFATGSVPEMNPLGMPSPSSSESFLSAPFEQLVHLSFKDARARLVHDFERAYVERILERTGGNVTKAAALAKMNRSYFGVLAKKSRGR